MIEIDGSEGEGGGQIVRSAVALSVVTGIPVRIRNVRAKRDKPGLRRQHLTALKATASICNARIDGAAIGSNYLSFEPQAVEPGEYHFEIGTAGSTSLVLQTVLPGLFLADQPSTVILEGGTHNPGAPPFDFVAKAYLPLLEQMGPRVEATLERPGFYPVGGGRLVVHVTPVKKLTGLELLERGEVRSRKVRAITAKLPTHIAQRERDWIAAKSGWHADELATEQWDTSRGPGNIVLIEIVAEHVTEVFSGFGQKGVRAEQVAEQVWNEAQTYLDSNVPAGHFLTDQLLLPLGLAAHAGSPGAFRTEGLSSHAVTHMDILQRFLQIQFTTQALSDGTLRVSVQPAPG